MGGWSMAALCWAAIMAPGLAMALGVLPFWSIVRKNVVIQSFLQGVNAAAAGLMAAGCVHLILRIVGESTAKAAALVFLVGVQQTYHLKAPSVIAAGVILGVSVWLSSKFEFHLLWSEP